MSSRLAGDHEKSLAKPASWPRLQVAAAVGAPPAQTDALRLAFAETLERANTLQTQVEELEKALQLKERLGYERGLAEGRVQGHQEAHEQQKPVLDRMVRSIEELAMLRPRLRMQSEAGLVRLCVAIAHRVLKRELHLDPLALEGIVKAALIHAGADEVFRVRVHPRQAEAVRAHLSKLGVPETVTVEPVSSMDEGDVMLETSAGAIDASINTQIVEVERGLTAQFGG